MSQKLKKIVSMGIVLARDFYKSSSKLEFIKNNQKQLFVAVAVLMFGVLGGGYALYKTTSFLTGMIFGAGDDEMALSMERRSVGVEAMKAVLGTTSREVKTIGILKANAEVEIKSEIAAKIKSIEFTEGAHVEKGQPLILFEDDLFKAAKNKADAEHALRKSEYERVDKLLKQNAGSQKNYDEAMAHYNMSRAELASAEAQLEKTVIKAPFSGIVGIMKVNPGNIVQQQTELVNIVDNSQMKVEFMVPAKHIDNIAVGQSVEIDVDAFPGKTFNGRVDAIDSEVDTKNHSILVRAVIPNKSGILKHGLYANVKLVTGEKSGVILVDEDALDREGSIEFVWFIDEKERAYRRRVFTGARNIDGVEIIAGLSAGDYVVTAGHLKLSDGVKVTILNNKKDENAEEGETSPEVQDTPKEEPDDGVEA